jgi:hypothetical protein
LEEVMKRDFGGIDGQTKTSVRREFPIFVPDAFRPSSRALDDLPSGNDEDFYFAVHHGEKVIEELVAFDALRQQILKDRKIPIGKVGLNCLTPPFSPAKQNQTLVGDQSVSLTSTSFMLSQYLAHSKIVEAIAHNRTAREHVLTLALRHGWDLDLSQVQPILELFDSFCLFSSGGSLSPMHHDQPGVLTEVTCLSGYKLWVIYHGQYAEYVLLQPGSRL